MLTPFSYERPVTDSTLATRRARRGSSRNMTPCSGQPWRRTRGRHRGIRLLPYSDVLVAAGQPRNATRARPRESSCQATGSSACRLTRAPLDRRRDDVVAGLHHARAHEMRVHTRRCRRLTPTGWRVANARSTARVSSLPASDLAASGTVGGPGHFPHAPTCLSPTPSCRSSSSALNS
jgi:hypothetical protein